DGNPNAVDECPRDARALAEPEVALDAPGLGQKRGRDGESLTRRFERRTHHVGVRKQEDEENDYQHASYEDPPHGCAADQADRWSATDRIRCRNSTSHGGLLAVCATLSVWRLC